MQKKVLLLLAFVTLLLVIPTHAQSSVDSVVITNIYTDIEIFPQITVNGFFSQADGTNVSGISKEVLQLTENGQTVDFKITQVDAGSHTTIVFDMGKWIDNSLTRDNQKRVKEIMLDIALHYIGTMNDNDFVQIIAIYSDAPIIMQDFTNEKDRLRDVVNNLSWNNDTHTSGLEALGYAISSLSKQENAFSKRILFLSPGIMKVNPFGEYKESIAESAFQAKIPIHSVNVNWNYDHKLYGESIEYVATETNGVFVPYLSEQDLDILYSSLDDNQASYQFTYRSLDGTSIQRTVELTYTSGGGISDSKIYNIDPALIAPFGVSVNVNNGQDITVNSEKEDEPVPIQVTLNGVGNRRITDVSFWVDGANLGSLAPDDAGIYTTIWNISPRQLKLPRGDIEVTIHINILDELDVVHEGIAASRITVDYALVEPCKTISKLGAGDGLVDACTKSGITLTTLLFIIIAIALAVALWLKRDTVAEVGKVAKVRITNAVERLTNRLTKLEPKARLIAMKGIADGERKEFDMFGETPVGVDNEFSKLVLDNPNISGLHCTFHEDHEGIWTIEDQESTNGTFVNGKRISPFSPQEIETGVTIELAPVEYGGIKFRFEVIDPFAEDTNERSIYDEQSDNEKETLKDVRVTQRNTQPRDFGNEEIENDSEKFEPSDPANQSW